jgi:type II secretory pathway component PulF
VSIDLNQPEEPPVLIPVDPQPARSRGGVRLRHLMFATLYVAVFCAVGLATGLGIVSGLFGLVVAIVIGSVMIYGSRRSTQQDSLLWALAIAAERRMPLAPTLEAFAGQCRGGYRRKVLSAARSLGQGRSLAQVLDQERGLFPRDVNILIRVGSDTGELAKAFREASDVRSHARRPWLALAIRSTYLLWVIMVLESVIGFISYFILPKFEAIFADFGAPLPSITIFFFEVTHSLTRYWPLFLLIVAFQFGLLIVSSLSILGILPWQLPIVDRLFGARHSALILRCMAQVIEANRPLPQGFATLAQSYPSAEYGRRLRAVARDVHQGGDWCESMTKNRLIRPSEAALLESARRVGNLPWAMRQAAESSERRLAYRFQFWLQWLAPVMVSAIGAVVFLVVVAYFTPLVFLIRRLA